jgi:hypothetical protein
MPMFLDFGHRAGDDAGQIGRVLDVVVEHREVRRVVLGQEARAHQIGGFGIVARHLARGILDGEDFADDQVVAGFGIFAHDALIIIVRGVFGEHILDIAARDGGVGGLVDAADPLLFHRHGVDRRDFERPFGARAADETRHGERRGTGCGTGKHLTAFEEIGWIGQSILVMADAPVDKDFGCTRYYF